ncbi:MAG: biotin/lipoyl-binding protein [Dehalococcoidia bacterium]|nr:biotin/lipoyl-binding protein [Dehalococcoidia bacterium]
MFRRVLVANRGEIAVRIIATLRALGIESVVTASIPDRAGLAVRRADAWALLPGSSAAESYLDQDAVIAAAKAHGCDAIHPGYGFLSENAAFAERCAAEGVVFIGPPPAVLRALGDKATARRFAAENGVPIAPGYDGPDDDAALTEAAARIGYPVMVKARAGGGGRGMREVHTPGDLADALAGARREAAAAFGDPGLLLERLITGAHHVEVQVLGDTHGTLVHLGERDCSVQRRRQKLIEEAPSPVVDAALREALTGAALRLARAVGYVNAGTFEFLVGEAGDGGVRPFYFLEVNPRLQVEHRVTEAITGLDLVELQLRVAAGEPLPFAQQDVVFEGHAMEARLNAEDPRDGFRPATGRLGATPGAGGDWRIDTGFEAGDTIPPHYDSLVAKGFVHETTREDAIRALAHACATSPLCGVRGNTRLLHGVLTSEAFATGGADIGWLERELPAVLARGEAPWEALAAAAASAVLRANPFGGGAASIHIDDGARVHAVTVTMLPGRRLRVSEGERDLVVRAYATPEGPVHITAEGSRSLTTVQGADGAIHARDADSTGAFTHAFAIVAPPPLPRRAHTAGEGASVVTAPLAGTIASVRVAEGQAVAAGDLLLTMEAMKMEHRITAPTGGAVTHLAAAPGAVVREGDPLLELR